MNPRLAACCLVPCLAVAVGAQSGAPPCKLKPDALATRRAAVEQNGGLVTAANLAAQQQVAASDPDRWVLIGDYYAAQQQSGPAASAWNSATENGDALGYEAVAEHAQTAVHARRVAWAAAAQLGDARGEYEYGLMLMLGQGGPRLQLIGREYVIQAANDGFADAAVAVGAGLLGLADADYAEVFQPLRDSALANCYLTAVASADVAARRVLRQAYEANILQDPLPRPNLSDAGAFTTYLSSFASSRQLQVLTEAMSREQNSPNFTRALEERVWLSPPPTAGELSPNLLALTSQQPNDATGLYFSLVSALPTLTKNDRGQAEFHTAQALQLGSRWVQMGQAGLAALDNPTTSMGLDQSQILPRMVAARRVFTTAAALAPAVAEGNLWLHPAGGQDVVTNYLYARGGLDRLNAVAAAWLVVSVDWHQKDDDQQWQRELLVGNTAQYPWAPPDQYPDIDSFTVPTLDPATRELIVTNGHGWLMKSDRGPNQWKPDDAPDKRDNRIPVEFGQLHAPAAGDLDDPLIEYARRMQAHLAAPSLNQALVRDVINNRVVYHLVVGRIAADGSDSQKKNNDDSNHPDFTYDAYIDAQTYQLVRLQWSWQPGKDTETVDYDNFRQQDGLTIPQRAFYTIQPDDNSDHKIVVTNMIVRLDLHPTVPDGLFSMNHDEANKIKQYLAKKAKQDKDQNGGS